MIFLDKKGHFVTLELVDYLTELEQKTQCERANCEVVNLIGLECPEPLMMLRQSIRQALSQQQFMVLATDKSTLRDFENFCGYMGHELRFKLELKKRHGTAAVLGFLIKKR